jgi:hypothetical protein
MTENSALVLVVMLTIAVALYKFWKQIIGILVISIVIGFGYGVYSFAVAMTN